MIADFASIRKIWDSVESQGVAPSYLRNVVELDYHSLRRGIELNDLHFLENVIFNLYSGDVIILKGGLSHQNCEEIVKNCSLWLKTEPESFSKTIDGCRNFHRMQSVDEASASYYSFLRVQRQFYCYRWNGDRYGFFKIADPTWRFFKQLCGWTPNAFERNIPSDLVVDRLHIHHYPRGIGRQEMHTDPFGKQKFIQGCMLSKRGRDYHSGGINYVSRFGHLVDVDQMLCQGDFYISYPSLKHSVEIIDPGSDPTCDLSVGRWFMGFYSLDSDHVVNKDRGWPAKM